MCAACRPAAVLNTRGSVRARQSARSSLSRVTTAMASAQGKVSWLGLGIMGKPMSRNLVKAGYDVTVWNRKPEKAESLVEEGATHARGVREAVRGASVIFAMVSDPEAAEDLALGSDGVVEHISAGQMYVDCSTIDAETAKRVGEAVEGKGAKYLEAPVAGSKGPAEQGQLIFMAAGREEVYGEVAPMLDVMGKKRVFLGDAGNGSKMKLVNNAVMGVQMEALAEGIALAESSGLSSEDAVDVITNGAMKCPMFDLKGPAMCEANYQTAFPLKHQQKDLRLALALGDDGDQGLSTVSAANERYKEAKALGLGDADFSAVLEASRRRQS